MSTSLAKPDEGVGIERGQGGVDDPLGRKIEGFGKVVKKGRYSLSYTKEGPEDQRVSFGGVEESNVDKLGNNRSARHANPSRDVCLVNVRSLGKLIFLLWWARGRGF